VRFLGEAFARFHKDRPDSRLLLIGDGEEAPLLRQVLQSAGVDDAAHWLGLVDRGLVPEYLAAADVLVSPHAAGADFIGSPIKIFEYMATGRAIVASDFAQMGEILRDGETALLAPPADPAAMAAAFERLYSDPDLRGRLGAAAQDEARRLHSWDARMSDILAAAAAVE
jgi:glycosyltransferase involved in cell wall biosynthesis